LLGRNQYNERSRTQQTHRFKIFMNNVVLVQILEARSHIVYLSHRISDVTSLNKIRTLPADLDSKMDDF
jgi:hypothetical protein